MMSADLLCSKEMAFFIVDHVFNAVAGSHLGVDFFRQVLPLHPQELSEMISENVLQCIVIVRKGDSKLTPVIPDLPRSSFWRLHGACTCTSSHSFAMSSASLTCLSW